MKTAVCVRLSDDTINSLDWLCDAFKLSRADVVNNLICSAYDEYHDNEKLHSFLSKMNDLQNQIKDIADSIV